MKKLFIISIIFLASCKTNSLVQSMPGHYYKKGKDYRYILDLNNDSSFTFKIQYREGSVSCQGKWQYILKDTLLLKCGGTSLSEMLQRGYMEEREKKVIVISKNKLKVDSQNNDKSSM